MFRLATTITLTLVVTLTIVHHALSIEVNDECRCGIENNKEEMMNKVARRIIGGQKVAAGKYPWLVFVITRLPGKMIGECVGAIINDKFVMTAAHCVDKITSAVDVKVYHELEHSNMYSMRMESRTALKVKNFFKHTEFERVPDKNDRVKNDIALLELEESFVFNDTVSPICLTPQMEPDNYFAAGWGAQGVPKMVDGEMDFSGIPNEMKDVDLSEIPLERISDKECLERSRDTLVEYHICVQGLKEGPNKEIKSNICVGDSGGPLMTRDKDGPLLESPPLLTAMLREGCCPLLRKSSLTRSGLLITPRMQPGVKALPVSLIKIQINPD